MEGNARNCPADDAVAVDSMKFLAVGPLRSTTAISSRLVQAGHRVTQARDFAEATEMFVEHPFDAVLILGTLPSGEVAEFAAAVRQFESQSGGRHAALLFVTQASGVTPILPLTASTAGFGVVTSNLAASGIDGVVPESIDPDSLTLAIARLASAVSLPNPAATASALAPELPILAEEELKAQVAFDPELLTELIDLYLSERVKQSSEMEAAMKAGDYVTLARVAHTIKGSLGSLHAAAARATSHSLELAARERDEVKCRDFLPTLQRQLDVLEDHLVALKESFGQP